MNNERLAREIESIALSIVPGKWTCMYRAVQVHEY